MAVIYRTSGTDGKWRRNLLCVNAVLDADGEVAGAADDVVAMTAALKDGGRLSVWDEGVRAGTEFNAEWMREQKVSRFSYETDRRVAAGPGSDPDPDGRDTLVMAMRVAAEEFPDKVDWTCDHDSELMDRVLHLSRLADEVAFVGYSEATKEDEIRCSPQADAERVAFWRAMGAWEHYYNETDEFSHLRTRAVLGRPCTGRGERNEVWLLFNTKENNGE